MAEGFTVWNNEKAWKDLPFIGQVWAARCKRCKQWVAKYEETREQAEAECRGHVCGA